MKISYEQTKTDRFINPVISHNNILLDLGWLDFEGSLNFLRTLLVAAAEITYKYQNDLELTDKSLDVTLDCFSRESKYFNEIK